MDMEKLTTKSREAMIASQNIAAEYGHQEIRPIHLLKALVDQEGGLIPSLLKKMNVDFGKLSLAMENHDAVHARAGIERIIHAQLAAAAEHAFGQRTGRSAELYVARFQPDSDPGKRDRRTHEG